MSDKRNEDLKQFIIPENFMGESRLFQGQLKTRNVVEGGLISGVLAIFFWNVISVAITTKISLVIFLSAPLGLLGLFGVNGDPLSTFIKIFFSWRRKRGLMLFNNEARALKEAPIKLMMSEDGMGDKLRDFLDTRKEKKAAERASQEMKMTMAMERRAAAPAIAIKQSTTNPSLKWKSWKRMTIPRWNWTDLRRISTAAPLRNLVCRCRIWAGPTMWN